MLAFARATISAKRPASASRSPVVPTTETVYRNPSACAPDRRQALRRRRRRHQRHQRQARARRTPRAPRALPPPADRARSTRTPRSCEALDERLCPRAPAPCSRSTSAPPGHFAAARAPPPAPPPCSRRLQARACPPRGSPDRRRAGPSRARRARSGRRRPARRPRRSAADSCERREAAHQVGHQRRALARARERLGDALHPSHRAHSAHELAPRAPRRDPCRRDRTDTRGPARPRGSASTHASACAVSSAGMMPSRRASSLKAVERLAVGHRHIARATAVAQEARAAVPRPGSPGRPTPSAPP